MSEATPDMVNTILFSLHCPFKTLNISESCIRQDMISHFMLFICDKLFAWESLFKMKNNKITWGKA